MRMYESKEVNGYLVRKEGHPIHRTRSGYALACYAIYEDETQMKEYKPICRCYTMADVREEIKYIKE